MIIENYSQKERGALVDAICENMGTMSSVFPTSMPEIEHEALKRAEKEHAPNVAVRIVNFRVQYYNTVTGEVVSEHC